MCGRFAQVIKYQDLKKMTEELKIKESSEQLELNYNVAPTNIVAAVVAKDDWRYMGFFRWGLIPSWSKKIPEQALINVRSESILEKPSFKTSFLRRRCLIPANGFYEWRKTDKQPFFIKAKGDNLLYLAGIYDAWYGPDGSYIPSLGIITTSANDFIQPLHERMPLLLNPSLYDTWLNPAAQNPQELQLLLTVPSEIELEMYPVSRRVNKPENNDADCLKPIAL
ncbi:MAG TPA: SOS response-associated peptidase [Candidatus Cloacimonas acidaminovorans]|jgi:putative SOS response-associated peptidase YedK|nr:SOS response-associated peptidase [Candidatus Cloacimonadota bacterium]HNV61934.1 SOS response-associated peptidase [Candidatus Cloacimonas acidaminovorans]